MLCLRPANRFFSTNSVESGFIGLFGQVSHPCIPAQHARRPDLRLKLRLKLRINVQDQCEGTFLEIGACLAPWPRQHACAAQRPTAPPCICVLDAVAEIACVSPYQGREMESLTLRLFFSRSSWVGGCLPPRNRPKVSQRFCDKGDAALCGAAQGGGAVNARMSWCQVPALGR